jgi:hypothetical protein
MTKKYKITDCPETILSTIEIEVKENGFTVWVKEDNLKHWILDGSEIKKDGMIRMWVNDIWSIIPIYDGTSDEIKIMQRPTIKKGTL